MYGSAELCWPAAKLQHIKLQHNSLQIGCWGDYIAVGCGKAPGEVPNYLHAAALLILSQEGGAKAAWDAIVGACGKVLCRECLARIAGLEMLVMGWVVGDGMLVMGWDAGLLDAGHSCIECWGCSFGLKCGPFNASA